jgi:hypothetical protein
MPRTTSPPGRARRLARRRESAFPGDQRRDVDLDLAAGGLPPKQAVNARPRLAQLQESGPQRELGQQRGRVTLGRGAAPIGAQVHLTEGHLGFDPDAIGMLVQPGPELRVGGRRLVGAVLDEEFELLAKPAPDDGVVAVQTRRERVARGHLLAHVVVHEALELLTRRRPLPAAGEAGHERIDLPGPDDDSPRPGPAVAAPGRHGKEQRAEHEEVDERLTQPTSPHGVLSTRRRVPDWRGVGALLDRRGHVGGQLYTEDLRV